MAPTRKTHCARGHALTNDNVVQLKDGRRRCKTCRYDAHSRWLRGESTPTSEWDGKCSRCGETSGPFRPIGRICTPCHSAYYRARYRNNEDLRSVRRDYERAYWLGDSTRRRFRKLRSKARFQRFDRLRIYERDGGRCHICKDIVPIDDFHLDHLIPLSRGGDHTPENVAVAHPSCNMRRGPGRIPAQLRLIG